MWGVKKYLFDLLLKVDDKLDLYNEHESESRNFSFVLYKRKEGGGGEGGFWVGDERINNTGCPRKNVGGLGGSASYRDQICVKKSVFNFSRGKMFFFSNMLKMC